MEEKLPLRNGTAPAQANDEPLVPSSHVDEGRSELKPNSEPKLIPVNSKAVVVLA